MARKQRPPSDEPLTAAQIRFCERYVEHGNATRAFCEAEMTAKTPSAARLAASWQLSKQNVRQFLDEIHQNLLDAAHRSFTERLERDFGNRFWRTDGTEAISQSLPNANFC